MSHIIVIRYGEIFLKGGNRRFFEKRLVHQAKRLLKGVADTTVTRIHGRIVVDTTAAQTQRAIDRLLHLFGAKSFSPAVLIEPTLEAASLAAIDVAKQSLAGAAPPRSFRITSRRSDKSFPLSSMALSQQVGGAVFTATGLAVDLHNPDLTIGVEIGPERSFVFADRVPGPGGLPVGVTGGVNLLLSGGIDSPVAGWLAMKRGCSLAATYFHSFPYTGDKTKQKVIDVLRILAPWQGTIPLSVVHFTEVQKALREAGPGPLAVVLYRRMMMRTAARMTKINSAQVMVTGENLAQVASQTLENIAVVEQACPLPILRPLCMYDKSEIMDLARRINTYETSILPYEDCCSLFVPAHPATKAKLSAVLAAEAKLDVDAMAQSLADEAEVIYVSEDT